MEHDVLALYAIKMTSAADIEPPPASTGVVDTAIELFSLLLPTQSPETTGQVVNQVVDAVRSPKLDRNSGRKAAVRLNATYAILCALRHAMRSNIRQARDIFGGSNVSSAILDFLKVRVRPFKVGYYPHPLAGWDTRLGHCSPTSRQRSNWTNREFRRKLALFAPNFFTSGSSREQP